MKQAKNYDFIMTIVFAVVTLGMLWMTFLCMGGVDLIAEWTGHVMDHDVDPDSIVAGYEVLGVFFLGSMGILGSIMAFVMGIFFGFFGVCLLVTTIFAFVRQKKYNETFDPTLIKKNLRGKMIWNSILLGFSLMLLFSEFSLGLLLFILVVAVFETFYIKFIKESV